MLVVCFHIVHRANDVLALLGLGGNVHPVGVPVALETPSFPATPLLVVPVLPEEITLPIEAMKLSEARALARRSAQPGKVVATARSSTRPTKEKL